MRSWDSVPGLTSGHIKARLVRPMLRPALAWAMRRPRSRTVVQNAENAKFVESLGVRRERISLVQGVGVDVRTFRPRPAPAGPIRVAMVSRLLWDKGVREFIRAAALVREARGDIVFTLVGCAGRGQPYLRSSGAIALLGGRRPRRVVGDTART